MWTMRENYNFRIYKESDDTNTRTGIDALSEEEKVLEIARLLGGINITDAAISNAKELIEASR